MELPTPADLERLAPEKNLGRIRKSMAGIQERITESKVERRANPKARVFAPAGQSTQMIVGATPTHRLRDPRPSSSLYQTHRLRRVYYSAFSPIPDASSKLPLIAPPLVRDHRLYQADWLIRFYGFRRRSSPAPKSRISTARSTRARLGIANRHVFPVDINKSPRELLLRVPGLGVKNVDRILQVRRWKRLNLADLATLHVPMKKTLPFIQAADHNPHVLGWIAPLLWSVW